MEGYLYELQLVSRDIWTCGHRRAISNALSCMPSLVEVSEVVDKVFRVQMQVDGLFGMLGPLVRHLWDPSRWGPLGTHVSQVSGRH
jgi:hypothetical protein